MTVLSQLLDTFRTDLDVSWDKWNAGEPSVHGCSVGQIITAAANSFRHADEWKRARFAKRYTKEQRRSMNVLNSVLGISFEVRHADEEPCELVCDLLSAGDFVQLARNVLTFANNLAVGASP
jgi:hypothetical protein